MFVIKTPSIEDSSITYNEPKGIKNQYTGGSVFYEQDFSQYAPSTNFIQPLVLNNDGSINLANGLMSYVVGSAINMIRSGKKYTLLKESYDNLNEAKISQVPVYSMVYHPASDTEEHFLGKQEIVYWLNNGTMSGFEYDDTRIKNQDIHPDSFKIHFLENEDDWERWITIFNNSIEYCNKNFHGADYPEITNHWSDIKKTILTEIIPNLKIKVINSKAEGSI